MCHRCKSHYGAEVVSGVIRNKVSLERPIVNIPWQPDFNNAVLCRYLKLMKAVVVCVDVARCVRVFVGVMKRVLYRIGSNKSTGTHEEMEMVNEKVDGIYLGSGAME